MPSGVYKRTEYHKNKLKESIQDRMKNGWVPTIVGWHKGKNMPDEQKRKIGDANKISRKGIKLSDVTKEKMRKRMLGNKNTLGVFPSEETKKKMSEAAKERVRLGLNNFFQDGKFCKKYPDNWTTSLRRAIRERDNYVCQMCSALQDKRAFSVHHIDYDKKNCNPDNLITLCVSCHAKTNQKREYWIEYFKNIKRT